MTGVLQLVDQEGSFATLRQAFGVDDDAPWVLQFFVYVLELDGVTVVVDTGLGPPGDDPFMPERDGRLPAELAAAGVAPADVDLVVLTHLHPDHVGWNMVGGAPFFPNAHYVAQRADYDFFTTKHGHRPYVQQQIVALHDSGSLELLDGLAEPLPGLRIEPTGGHTPGHSIVRLSEVTLAADLAVHPLQLENHDLPYVAEDDQPAIAAARRRLLPALAGTRVGFGHIPLGIL
jgi:glyoxylase-like metal-dependent hydrolase (beta-lactamase superfamily II)